MLPHLRYFLDCVIKIWAKESKKFRVDDMRITRNGIHNSTLRNFTSTVQESCHSRIYFCAGHGSGCAVLQTHLQGHETGIL